jgi:hypothetical protein
MVKKEKAADESIQTEVKAEDTYGKHKNPLNFH